MSQEPVLFVMLIIARNADRYSAPYKCWVNVKILQANTPYKWKSYFSNGMLDRRIDSCALSGKGCFDHLAPEREFPLQVSYQVFDKRETKPLALA